MPMPRSVALIAILSLISTPAAALKLTNRDTSEQKMTISENSGSRDQVLKPSETVEGFCSGGCSIKMQDGEEYEFDGNEIVSIEDGLMFLDDPAPGSAAESQKQ
jgi:hypothetical protein